MISAVLITLITAAVLYVLLFEDWDEFLECVKFCFTPEIISALRGKYWEDVWAEIKILLWLGISATAGVSVYIWPGQNRYFKADTVFAVANSK